MRGDIVFRVYGVHSGRDEEFCFDAFSTRGAAEACVNELQTRLIDGESWAARFYDQGFVIREAIVDTNFEIPSRPKPRDKYFVKASMRHAPGTWPTSSPEIFRRGASEGEAEKIAAYERNYSMLETFEPFRQGTRELALISRTYTATAVMDLASGEVIAEEPAHSGGFCPLGFYVPDWWDVHNGSTIPGSPSWGSDHEWPCGDFGFVWGCVWGDDSSWKVEYLDLRRVQEGVLRREDRFGYLELATHGFRNPCFDPDVRLPSRAPPFIRVTKFQGVASVTFAVEMSFELTSGKAADWTRERVSNLD